jgi:uncharacterized membrane protein
MWTWHTFWTILHILGAVVAFGPVYAAPMIAARGRRNPEHAVLAAEITEGITTRYTIPFGLTVPITGIGLMATEEDIDFDETWLWVSVVLYVIALAFALAQLPSGLRMVRLLRSRRRGRRNLDGHRPPRSPLSAGRWPSGVPSSACW